MMHSRNRFFYALGQGRCLILSLSLALACVRLSPVPEAVLRAEVVARVVIGATKADAFATRHASTTALAAMICLKAIFSLARSLSLTFSLVKCQTTSVLPSLSPGDAPDETLTNKTRRCKPIGRYAGILVRFADPPGKSTLHGSSLVGSLQSQRKKHSSLLQIASIMPVSLSAFVVPMLKPLLARGNHTSYV